MMREAPFNLVRDSHYAITTPDGEQPQKLPFPAEYGHWLFVGVFRHDPLPGRLHEHVNFGILADTLQQTCGRACFKMFSVLETGTADSAKPLITFLAVDPDNARAIDCAAALMALHHNGEHMSDEAYWQEVDVYVQRFWAQMPMADRLELVLATGVPPAIAVSETVPDGADAYGELWTRLYQDMDL